MRRPALVLVAALAGGPGCGPPEPPPWTAPVAQAKVKLRPPAAFRKRVDVPPPDTQEVVFRALSAEADAYTQAVAGLEPSAPASALAKAVGGYAERLGQADPAAAPEAVRQAFDGYRGAVRGLAKALARLPDGGYTGTRLHDALAAPLRGDRGKLDDARRLLGGDPVGPLEGMIKHMADIYKASAEHGIEVDMAGGRPKP